MGGADYSVSAPALSTRIEVRYGRMRRARSSSRCCTAAACGGKPPLPKRGVVEKDLGSWKFRRFQGPLLDVEVWVEGNKAEAYSASYVTDRRREDAAQVEDKDIVNVFVTRYERDDGVMRETVKLARRLAAEKWLSGRRGQDRRRARAHDQRAPARPG